MDTQEFNSKAEALAFLKEGLDAELDLLINNETDYSRAVIDDYADMIEQVITSPYEHFTIEECPMAPSQLNIIFEKTVDFQKGSSYN